MQTKYCIDTLYSHTHFSNTKSESILYTKVYFDVLREYSEFYGKVQDGGDNLYSAEVAECVVAPDLRHLQPS